MTEDNELNELRGVSFVDMTEAMQERLALECVGVKSDDDVAVILMAYAIGEALWRDHGNGREVVFNHLWPSWKAVASAALTAYRNHQVEL